MMGLGPGFAIQRGLHAAFFVGAEPAGVGNPVVQQEEHSGAQGHGRQAFDHEQPLPAGVTRHAIEGLHDQAGNQ